MRTVSWEDENGYRHRSLLRDGDHDNMAAQGILQDPPSLEELDWQAVKRDLHNALVTAGLYTWRDMEQGAAGNKLMGAILSAMRTKIIKLYREVDNG